MNQNNINSEPIKITLKGFSDSNTKALIVFFDGYENGRYAITNGPTGQIHIIDVDVANNINLERYAQQHHDSTIIYISKSNIENAEHVINKPLKLSTLINTLDEITDKGQYLAHKIDSSTVTRLIGNDKKITSDHQSSSNKTTFGFKNQTTNKNNHLQSVAEHHENVQFWGVRWNTEIGEPVSEFYSPEHYLQGHLDEAIKLAFDKQKPVQLDTQFQSIIVLPQAHKIMIDCTDSRLQFTCLQKMRRNKTDSRQDYSIYPSQNPESFWLRNTEFHKNEIDHLLWKIALWTSRGRLPINFHPDTPCRLKQWPNFTRLQSEPYMLSLSALMTTHRVSIHELSIKLNMPSGFICQFVSAAQTIHLIENSSAPYDHKPSSKIVTHSTQSNFISRLFKRLAG